MIEEKDQIAAVAQRILHYLRIHPEAADTAEGVARWWLGRLKVDGGIELVAEALDRLFREGLVIQSVTRNGNTIYRRQRRRVPARKGRENETLH